MCVNECPNFHSLQTLKAMILSQLKKYRILKSCKLKIMTIFCPSGKAVATCFPVPCLYWPLTPCMAPRLHSKPLHGEGAIWGQIKLFFSECHNDCGWAVPNQDWDVPEASVRVWSSYSPCSRKEWITEAVGSNYKWGNWGSDEIFSLNHYKTGQAATRQQDHVAHGCDGELETTIVKIPPNVNIFFSFFFFFSAFETDFSM